VGKSGDGMFLVTKHPRAFFHYCALFLKLTGQNSAPQMYCYGLKLGLHWTDHVKSCLPTHSTDPKTAIKMGLAMLMYCLHLCHLMQMKKDLDLQNQKPAPFCGMSLMNLTT
jgi:hypothetical protein